MRNLLIGPKGDAIDKPDTDPAQSSEAIATRGREPDDALDEEAKLEAKTSMDTDQSSELVRSRCSGILMPWCDVRLEHNYCGRYEEQIRLAFSFIA
jgi:hypothetical protein